MSTPAITYETVELRCMCGELMLCASRGSVDLSEFMRSAIFDAGWRRIDREMVDVATFWDGEVQIRLYGMCPECTTKSVEQDPKRLKRAA